MLMLRCCFIDGTHLSILESETGIHLNYEKLCDELTKEDFRARTYYYDARPNHSDIRSSEERELT